MNEHRFQAMPTALVTVGGSFWLRCVRDNRQPGSTHPIKSQNVTQQRSTKSRPIRLQTATKSRLNLNPPITSQAMTEGRLELTRSYRRERDTKRVG